MSMCTEKMMTQVKVIDGTSNLHINNGLNGFFLDLDTIKGERDNTNRYQKFDWELVDIKFQMDGDGFNKMVLVIVKANFRINQIEEIKKMLEVEKGA